jgi:hypothetical protein
MHEERAARAEAAKSFAPKERALLGPRSEKGRIMSLPYPHDRARARQDEGQQPYKDAREAMSEKDARLQAQAEEFGAANLRETEEERLARTEAEAAERFLGVGEDAASG